MIKVAQDNKVRIIRLNRPEKRNALSPELVQALKEEISTAYNDDSTKVLVLTGEGNSFCSGADLEFIKKMQEFTYEENLADSNSLKELFKLIYSGPKPVIAAINGHAIAGGAGLVSVCDIAISIPQAKFGFSEVKIGFIPALVSVFLVRKIGESKAREMLLSGRLFQADEALKNGLVHWIVNPEELEREALGLATVIAMENSPESLKATKSLLHEISNLGLDEALDIAAQRNAEARGTEDCKEGILAFLEKRKPNW